MVYHCTTPKKLKRYEQTGCILSPVRYWTTIYAALKWCKKTGRSIILVFDEPENSYPLPVKNGAKWSNQFIRTWRVRHRCVKQS